MKTLLTFPDDLDIELTGGGAGLTVNVIDQPALKTTFVNIGVKGDKGEKGDPGDAVPESDIIAYCVAL